MRQDVEQRADDLAQTYKERLLDEADRLAAERDEGDELDPVSQNDLIRADRYLSRSRTNSRLTWLNYTGQVISYVAAIIAGYFVNNIDEPFGSIGLSVVMLVGVAGFLAYFLGGRQS